MQDTEFTQKERLKSVLTKEFSALADEQGKSSELSKFLFGEDLSEKIKEQIESNKITRHVANPLRAADFSAHLSRATEEFSQNN